MSSAKSAWSRTYKYRHFGLPALVKSKVHAFARLQVKEEVVRDITGVTGARDRGKRSEGVWGALRRRQEGEDCHVRG